MDSKLISNIRELQHLILHIGEKLGTQDLDNKQTFEVIIEKTDDENWRIKFK